MNTIDLLKKVVMKKLIFSLLASFIMLPAFSQLNITNTLTPTQLVQNVLLGSGVIVSNVNYTGAAVSRGEFTCGAFCNLGISSGIFLTTGNTSAPFAPAQSRVP